MNYLSKIGYELKYINRISSFTQSLLMLSNLNKSKYTHMLSNLNKISDRMTASKYSVSSPNTTKYCSNIANTADLIIGCDQKFCKGFMKQLMKIVKALDEHKITKMILLGRQFMKFQFSEANRNQIQCLPMIQSFDDAEYVSCLLNEYHIRIHSFVDGHCRQNILKLDTNIATYDRIYNRSINIHSYCLNSQIFENNMRSMSMYEASENSKTRATQLLHRYNKLRQSMITKQMIL